MRVLLVEDDVKIATFVADGLTRAGYSVETIGDGSSAEEMAIRTPYNVAVVDLMLPSQSGLTLIQNLRSLGIMIPIIVLSAKRSSTDKVACLQAGADDYLSKPFDLAELLARLDAILRRSTDSLREERLESSGVSVDLVSRIVWREGVRIDLPPREFALLELLIRNAGKPLTKSYLLERLWGFNVEPQTNIVDVLVCRLRNRIDRDFPEKLIRTQRALGYVFQPS